MNKPMLVARKEFSEKLAVLINESGLPLFVVQPILEQMNAYIGTLVEQQYLKEKEAWEKEGEKLEAERDQLPANEE